MQRNAIIMGAGGRDFHNFNIFFRGNLMYRVVAFTAGQIPFIEDRIYPPRLAGELYPDGIPIFSERMLSELIKQYDVRDVFFSYSDVSHRDVMHMASQVIAEGASFHLLGGKDTLLKSKKPVIAVTAVRTGAGKSSITRKVVNVVRRKGLRPVVVRHPMVYGSFEYPVQRFQSVDDLDKYNVTIEEREEYEGDLEKGMTVFAGIDYGLILKEAEKEGDLIIWDGGNNDLPFYHPDLHITVVDPLRPGHETDYYPGESNLKMADIIVINKVNVADPQNVNSVLQTSRAANPNASIVQVRSEAHVDHPDLVQGKRVLVVEDGPSLTHGGLKEGVGVEVVRKLGGLLVDPREAAVGSIKSAYAEYPHLGPALPALGYSRLQLKELEQSINNVQCDTVVLGTPADLTRLINIKKPVVRVCFEIADQGETSFESLLINTLEKIRPG